MPEEMAPVEKQADHPAGHGLRRALGVWGAAAFVVTSMVGTGIFTVPAFVRTTTGNGLAALGVWVVGAGLALSGALCYAELATRMPEAGGEYCYLNRVYGRLWGFLSGWMSFFVGFSASIAAAALGAVAYASILVPTWDPGARVVEGSDITQGAVAAAVLVAALAIFHSTGVRPSGRLQTIIAGLVIGAIVLFIVIGISTGRGNWSGVTAGSKPTGLWWVALIQVSFAYSGWNAAAYLSGEVRNPLRTLPRSLIGGTLAVAALYLALNILFLYALPADAWQPTIAVGNTAAQILFGPIGGQVVSAIIALTIIGSVSAMTAAGPRVYYAMSRDKLAPAVFSRLGRHSHAPTIATLAQAIVSVTLALTGKFADLLTYAGSALLLFAGLTVAAVYLVPRERAADAPRTFRVPGYPITPAVFLVLTAVAWVHGLRESPVPTSAALATIVIGIVIYFICRACGWLNGAPAPARQISTEAVAETETGSD
jgi:APA family basic amino acid/polyamine antiporter